MPADAIGQKITFAIQIDPDRASTPVFIRAKKGDTIRKIAARRGHPEMVGKILSLNKDVRIKNGHFLRSATQVLKQGTLLRLPGLLRQGDFFHVHADDPRPTVKDGYAKYDTVDRPGRVGISRFLGYNPIEIDIPIQFEGYADSPDGQITLIGSGVASAGSALLEGASFLTGPPRQATPGEVIEDAIAILEKMAGRGNYGGAADGPPAVIRVSVTDNSGNQVWLLPPNYQWSPQNQTAPLYRITNIAWDSSDYTKSDERGRRIRQKAVVTVRQYTPLVQIKRSATQRNRAKQSAGSALAGIGGL